MPQPLSTASSYQPDDALVVVRGRDFNQLFRVWEAMQLGRIEIKYAEGGGETGFNIPPDPNAPIQLILPKPSYTVQQVTFFDATCNPVVLNVLIDQ